MSAVIGPEEAIIAFASVQAWQQWLDSEHARHAKGSGVWLKLAKKASGTPSVSYREAVEVALCYGWIDGQKRPLDDAWWLQRFTPRGPRSKWSRINCAKATALIDSGSMHAAGLREVERARADGRWDAAYDPPSTATPPADLLAALDADEGAKAFFATLSSANRYAILYRIQDAKLPATRARRIAQFVEMLARGERPRPLL